MQTKIQRLAVLMLLVTALAPVAFADRDFPGRSLFVRAKPIGLEDLHARLGQVQLVDARTKYELDTLHIKDAVHLDLHDDAFRTKVVALRKQAGKPLAFYCNGRTCYKSYEADVAAREAGVQDRLVFDAGVLEWAKAYPDLAVLLGKAPMDPAQLISEVRAKKQPLFVDDMAGKQVRWLQYFLENLGVKDDYFMRGGVKAYFARVIRRG